jgi:hypothetical protein
VSKQERTEVFEDVYLHRKWRVGASASGSGSELEETVNLRKELLLLVCDLKIESLLDAPCGDFNWMRAAELPLKKYIGLDIAPSLIAENNKLYGSPEREFVVGDIVEDVLPQVDMILCRDCLQHLILADAVRAAQNFMASNAKYLVTSTVLGIKDNNTDIITGGCRQLNLEMPPFNLGKPFRVITEGGNDGVLFNKSLGVWRISHV